MLRVNPLWDHETPRCRGQHRPDDMPEALKSPSSAGCPGELSTSKHPVPLLILGPNCAEAARHLGLQVHHKGQLLQASTADLGTVPLLFRKHREGTKMIRLHGWGCLIQGYPVHTVTTWHPDGKTRLRVNTSSAGLPTFSL